MCMCHKFDLNDNLFLFGRKSTHTKDETYYLLLIW